MHLSDIVEKLNYKITGGSEYQWNCYPCARFLDFESEYATISVVFNSDKQMVYEITVDSKKATHRPYRWIDPDFLDAYESEARKRDIDPEIAWEKTKYIVLETENDILQKTTAIFKGETVDPRIEIELTLDDETILELAKQAHSRDITLNKMVEIVLQQFIDQDTVNGFDG